MGIFDSRRTEIDSLIASGDVAGASMLAAKMARQLNQRFRRLEDKGVGLKDSAYRYAQRETGRTKPRYSENANIYSTYSNQELHSALFELDAKLSSKTSSVQGLNMIEKKWINKTIQGLRAKGFNIEDEQKFGDFLKGPAGAMLNEKFLDPYESFKKWIDYVQDKNITNQELVDAFKASEGQERKMDEYMNKYLNAKSKSKALKRGGTRGSRGRRRRK